MEDIKALGFIWTFRDEHYFLDGELSSVAATPFLAVAAHQDDCSPTVTVPASKYILIAILKGQSGTRWYLEMFRVKFYTILSNVPP